VQGLPITLAKPIVDDNQEAVFSSTSSNNLHGNCRQFKLKWHNKAFSRRTKTHKNKS